MTNFPKTGRFIGFNKHILFITPGFPADEQDTQCIPALHIYAKALKESGTQVSIISIHYPYKSKPYQWNGIAVYPLNGANKKWKLPLLTNKMLSTAKKIHKERPVAVVHAFWLHRATLLAEKVSKSLQVPLVATAMGQEMRNPNRLFQRWEEAKFPIVSLSKYQENALKKRGVIPTDIIAWGVEEKRSSTKTIDLICVGSLIPLKNPQYFLELCSQLKEQMPHFQARMVGDGPQRDLLEQRIKALGLIDNVQLLGSLPYAETQAIIAQSKVLVHASEFEGFGMIVIEAMASETHVLSTPVGIAQSLEIPQLIGDAPLDAAMVQMLLKSERPVAKLFAVSDTVHAYQTIYASVSRERAIDS
ncbi:MAG: hypothetical protein Crog4KO_17180 [Crocinitomicaceae bacterium]